MSKNNSKNAAAASNNNNTDNEIDVALAAPAPVEVKPVRTRTFPPSYTVFPARANRATGDSLVRFLHFQTEGELFAAVESCPALFEAGLNEDTAQVLTTHLRGIVKDNLRNGNAWKGRESCEYRLVTSRLVVTFTRNADALGDDNFSLDLSHKDDSARMIDRVLVDGKPPALALGNFIL